MRIKENAFKGLQHLNGAQVKPSMSKETGEQNTGVTGMLLFDLVGSGGSVFLTPDQVED